MKGANFGAIWRSRDAVEGLYDCGEHLELTAIEAIPNFGAVFGTGNIRLVSYRIAVLFTPSTPRPMFPISF